MKNLIFFGFNMPLLDRDNNRTIETERSLGDIRAAIQTRVAGELPAVSTTYERGLRPVRLPIERQQVGMLSDYATNVVYDRSLVDVRSPMQARIMQGRNVVDSTEPVTQVTVKESLPLGQTIANYYSGGGSGGARSYDNPITVVPGAEESGSNSNLGLIFLVLLVAGGGAYWYYKKGGFQ